jgi:hypothetical protein
MWLRNQINHDITLYPDHTVQVIDALEYDRKTGLRIKRNYRKMSNPLRCGMDLGLGT